MKRIIFSSIFILFLIIGINAGLFRVSNGYANFSGSRLTAALSPELIRYLQEQIVLILAKIKELQAQLNAIIASEQIAKETAPISVPILAQVPVASSTFLSTLKIGVTYPSLTLSSYGEKILTEFKLSSQEKVAIIRIRFKNNALYPIKDNYVKNLKLVNANTNEILATSDSFVGSAVEFKLATDNSKLNKGLMVSDNTYDIFGTILTPNAGQNKPQIRLDIESAEDLSVFDYSDLNRVADITHTNTFPIIGPIITTF